MKKYAMVRIAHLPQDRRIYLVFLGTLNFNDIIDKIAQLYKGIVTKHVDLHQFTIVFKMSEDQYLSVYYKILGDLLCSGWEPFQMFDKGGSVEITVLKYTYE